MFSLPISTYQERFTPRQRRQKRALMTHKYRGSIVVLSISKSVEPNEEQKEMTSGFQQVMRASAEIVSNRVVW